MLERETFDKFCTAKYPGFVAYAHLCLRGGDTAWAEDIVQDVLYSVWKRRIFIKWDPANGGGKIQAYCLRSIFNRCIDYLERRKTRMAFDAEESVFLEMAEKYYNPDRNPVIRHLFDQDLRASLDKSIEGLPADGLVTISNTTIIGDAQYSADGSSFTPLPTGNSLVAIWGSQPNYLFNNIIVPNTASVPAVSGTGSETVNLLYNQLGSVVNMTQTDLGGNVTGLAASNFDGLNWTNDCWQWDGTIGGVAPAKTTAADVIDRLNALNSAFISWIDTPDDHYDYYGVNRGEGVWWPGAYQK